MSLYCQSLDPNRPFEVHCHHRNLNQLLPFLHEAPRRFTLSVVRAGETHHLGCSYTDLKKCEGALHHLQLPFWAQRGVVLQEAVQPACLDHVLQLSHSPHSPDHALLPEYSLNMEVLEEHSFSEQVCLFPHHTPIKEMSLRLLTGRMHTPSARNLALALQYPRLPKLIRNYLLACMAQEDMLLEVVRELITPAKSALGMLNRHFYPLVFEEVS